MVAAVSKTAGPRFESWLPRLTTQDSTLRPAGNEPPVGGIIAYLLFFIAGVGFGYAAAASGAGFRSLFPLALGLFAL